MTFTLDTEVARVLQAALEKNGPSPAPPAGDVQTRRAVPARRRDDRRLGADLRRAGVALCRPDRRADAIPAVPAGTRASAPVPVEDAYAGLTLHPGVPHEYDAIAFDADMSRRAQADRDRVLAEPMTRPVRFPRWCPPGTQRADRPKNSTIGNTA